MSQGALDQPLPDILAPAPTLPPPIGPPPLALLAALAQAADETLPFPPIYPIWLESLTLPEHNAAPSHYIIEHPLHHPTPISSARTPPPHARTATFLARHETTGKHVCLKWLPSRHTSSAFPGTSPPAIVAAANRCATLRHQHLVSIIETHPAIAGVWIVMDYYNGTLLSDLLSKLSLHRGSLAALNLADLSTAWVAANQSSSSSQAPTTFPQQSKARTGPLAPLFVPSPGQASTSIAYFRVVCEWMRQLCSALALLHSAGLAHADLKPANILIQQDLQLILLDLDSCCLGPDANYTPRYAPPERLALLTHPPASQHRTPSASQDCYRWDVWGLGHILFELLTFQHAFPTTRPGHPPAAPDQPPSPKQIQWLVPPALDELCTRCLSIDPSLRPPSANAVLEQLSAIERQGLQPPAPSLRDVMKRLLFPSSSSGNISETPRP